MSFLSCLPVCAICGAAEPAASGGKSADAVQISARPAPATARGEGELLEEPVRITSGDDSPPVARAQTNTDHVGALAAHLALATTPQSETQYLKSGVCNGPAESTADGGERCKSNHEIRSTTRSKDSNRSRDGAETDSDSDMFDSRRLYTLCLTEIAPLFADCRRDLAAKFVSLAKTSRSRALTTRIIKNTMDQKDVANLNADLTTCWPSTSGDYALRDVLELPHDFVAGRDGVLPPNFPVALAAASTEEVSPTASELDEKILRGLFRQELSRACQVHLGGDVRSTPLAGAATSLERSEGEDGVEESDDSPAWCWFSSLTDAAHLRAHLFTDEELPPPIVSEESAVVISSDDAMSDLCFVLGGQWFLQAFDPDTFEPEILLPMEQHAHAGMDDGFTFSAPVSAAAASTAATSATSSDELFEDHGSASGVSASHHQHQGPKYINTDYYPPPTEDTDGHAGGGDFSTLLPVTGPRPPREDERAKSGGRVRNKHYPAAAAYVCDLSWLAQFPVAPVTERYGSLAFFDDKKRLLAFYNFEAARLIKRPSLSKRRASLSDDDALRRAAVWDRAKFHFRSTLYVHLLLQNLTNLLRTPNVALSLRRFLPSWHPLLTALRPVLLHTERTNRSVLALFSTGILQAVLGFGDRVFSEVVARFLQLGAHSTRHGASLPERVAWKFGLGAKNGSKLPGTNPGDQASKIARGSGGATEAPVGDSSSSSLFGGFLFGLAPTTEELDPHEDLNVNGPAPRSTLQSGSESAGETMARVRPSCGLFRAPSGREIQLVPALVNHMSEEEACSSGASARAARGEQGQTQSPLLHDLPQAVHGEDGTVPESYSIDENRSLPSAPFFHPQLVYEDVELSSLPLVTDGLELYSILDDHVGRLLSGILFGGAGPGPNKRAPAAAESAEPVDPQCVALEEFLAFVKLHHPALLASSSDDDRLGDSASKGKKGAVRPHLDRVALGRKLRLVLTETVWNCCVGFQDLSYLTEHASGCSGRVIRASAVRSDALRFSDHMEQLEEMNEGRASTAVVPNGVQAELNASNTLMADKEHFVLNLSLAAIMSQAEQPTLLQEAEAEAASGARRVAAGAASPGGVAAGGEDILGIFTPKLKVDLKKLASRVTSRNTRRSVRCPLFDPRVLKRGVRMDF